MVRSLEAFDAVTIQYRLKKVSSQSTDHSAQNLKTMTKSSYWSTFSSLSNQELVIELKQKALLSEMIIYNKNSSEVDISIAVENKPHAFIPVIGNHRLAHHRRGTISMGYLPTKYIRLQFAKDRNPSLQIYGIELKGMPTHQLEETIDRSLYQVIGRNTEHILFSSSLKTSRGGPLSVHVSGSRAWIQRKAVEKENAARKFEQRFSQNLYY